MRKFSPLCARGIEEFRRRGLDPRLQQGHEILAGQPRRDRFHETERDGPGPDIEFAPPPEAARVQRRRQPSQARWVRDRRDYA